LKIKVCKIFKFDAAHHLPGYNGMCMRPHGHTYTLEVEVTGDLITDDPHEHSMIIDFSKMKDIVQSAVLFDLDHHDLNEVLKEIRTTAESITYYIFARLQPAFKRHNVKLTRVRLYEGESGYAEVTDGY
jgi:6-pyruvoyltetrahydropterin/6-carboxytetrahydropterin synthase